MFVRLTIVPNQHCVAFIIFNMTISYGDEQMVQLLEQAASVLSGMITMITMYSPESLRRSGNTVRSLNMRPNPCGDAALVETSGSGGVYL